MPVMCVIKPSGGTSAYPTYIIVPTEACPYVCDLFNIQ